MQKKKCPVLRILGIIIVVAAAIVILPKVIKFISGKCSKDEVDDMDFEFEDEFEEMDSEAAPVEAAKVEKAKEEDIFEEE